MLFNFAITLLMAVLRPPATKGTPSIRAGRSAQDRLIKIDEQLKTLPGNETNLVPRKTKKDEEKKVNDGKENGILEGIEEELATAPEEEVVGFTPGLRSLASDDWNHGSYAVSAERSGRIEIYVPDKVRAGDTLFLFLSRTDGYLPLQINKWKRRAECFKTNNRQENCMRAAHCVERDGQYCLKFRRGDEEGNGKDLATVMFYRHVTDDDPGCWTFDLPGGSTTWAVLTAITNVDRQKPVLRVSSTSCDVEWDSVFPSVYGEKNDVLLLSQGFDDTASRQDFLPPGGTERLGWTRSSDEAGFLFGKKLDGTGQTGELVTRGPGGPKCKDVLLSVVVKRD